MPQDKPKSEIKVTDKRIFTAEGEIREEFRNEIKPSEPSVTPAPEPEKSEAPPQQKERRREQKEPPKETGDRRRTIADKAKNPDSAFTNFIEPLIAQAYMSLGMLRNPYQPQTKIDPSAARQMIDILTLLEEKTTGNLTPDEEDFLHTHLSELKLAYVQRTKSVG